MVGSGQAPRLHIGRLTITFGLAIALATLVSGMIVFAVARQQMRAEVDDWLAGDAKLLLPDGTKSTAGQVMAHLAAWERGHSFSEKGHLLYDRGGRIVSPGQIVLSRPRTGFSEVRFATAVACGTAAR
ncbi:MAG: hypothetical protein KGM18_06445 [Sphingomonadales bacterium]|nr:hypothetical protein [Sphingomonadales bacterium]